MAVNADFVLYVIEQLIPLARVKSRRMFGGVGLYADDLFFALIADDTLYFKVDDSNRFDYEQRGSKPFCPFPDKSDFSMSYYNVPADLLDDAEDLSRWARKSVAIALVAMNKKMKKTPVAKSAKAKKAKVSTAKSSVKKKQSIATRKTK